VTPIECGRSDSHDIKPCFLSSLSHNQNTVAQANMRIFKPVLRILKPGGRIFKIFSDKMLTLGLNFNTSISANYILKARAKTQV